MVLAFADPAIMAAYLALASPEAVFSWMTETATSKKYRRSYETVFEKQILQQLISRVDPLINFGIACYSDDADALASLWKSGDQALQLAIAGNLFRRGFAGLQFANWDELCKGELMKLVFSNPSMTHGALANYLERKEGFDKLSTEAWFNCLYFALRNPILRRPIEDDEFADDGWHLYEQGRPFSAAWRLLLTLENNKDNAAVLSDAYMGLADFNPPCDDPLMAQYIPTDDGSKAEASQDQWWKDLDKFTKNDELGKLAFVQLMLHKWQAPQEVAQKDVADDTEWPSNWGFIRQGIAAGAAKASYRKNLVAYVRDHPDKWVRAGYYHGFSFYDEQTVLAAHEKEPVFFREQAVFNDKLYLKTPAGRAFRRLVGNWSGKEWKNFSNDQMRRSVYFNRAMRLWEGNPDLYPHPEDDLDNLSVKAPKRESGETTSDYLLRRSEE